MKNSPELKKTVFIIIDIIIIAVILFEFFYIFEYRKYTDNLFKMLNQIIEERKKLFVDYNGSYDFYINHGGKQIPSIIVMINNVEGFLDTYNLI